MMTRTAQLLVGAACLASVGSGLYFFNHQQAGRRSGIERDCDRFERQAVAALSRQHNLPMPSEAETVQRIGKCVELRMRHR